MVICFAAAAMAHCSGRVTDPRPFPPMVGEWWSEPLDPPQLATRVLCAGGGGVVSGNVVLCSTPVLVGLVCE